MDPKVIIMPFNGCDNEIAALETALALAKKYRAHLDVWHVAPDPFKTFLPYSVVGGGVGYPAEVAVADMRAIKERAYSEAQKKYYNIIKRFDVPDISTPPVLNDASASLYRTDGIPGKVIAIKGRLADLIVLSRLSTEDDGRIDETIETVLFQSGRPVLLVPPGKAAKKSSGNILVAWNGSAEAARALAFAMPYLKDNDVRVITQQMPGEPAPDLVPADVAHCLKRHGMEVESGVCWNEDMKLPHCIIDAAKFDDVDMVVMGAYSHSRVRELILGGVTRYMLKHAEVPVFIVY